MLARRSIPIEDGLARTLENECPPSTHCYRTGGYGSPDAHSPAPKRTLLTVYATILISCIYNVYFNFLRVLSNSFPGVTNVQFENWHYTEKSFNVILQWILVQV